MQLFYLHEDHQLNAQAHCDPHVVKMPIEAMQLAVTAVYEKTEPLTPAKHEKYGAGFRRRKSGANRNQKENFIRIPLNKEGAPMRPTHRNHPCAIWTRFCRGNFMWTINYGLSLCIEYQHRYDKQHAAFSPLVQLMAYADLFEPFTYDSRIKEDEDTYHTAHALAMPDEFKRGNQRNKKSALAAYRRFYRHKVKTQLSAKGEPTLYWKRAPEPLWLLGENQGERANAMADANNRDRLFPQWLDFVWENYHRFEGRKTFETGSFVRRNKTRKTQSGVVAALWRAYRKEHESPLGESYKREGIVVAQEMLDYCISNSEYPPNCLEQFEYQPSRITEEADKATREAQARKWERYKAEGVITSEERHRNRIKQKKKAWGGGKQPRPPQRPTKTEGEKVV